MAKRRRLKKKPIIVLLLVVILSGLVISFGISKFREFNYRRTIEFQIISIGYELEDARIFIEKLSTEIINEVILDNPKNVNLPPLVREQYFIKENLERYLALRERTTRPTTNLDWTTIVAMVNVNADYDWYEIEKETDISKGNSMLVNKFFRLPDDFHPDIVPIPLQYAFEGHSIKREVLDAFREMHAAASVLGLRLIINSGFRDFNSQKIIYESLVNHRGREYADSIAARPGHSEHQTGLALDILKFGVGSNEFENTEEYKWLLSNAHKFGFILRYPKGKEHITGYRFEPWHFRFLGIELATKVHNSGITFDEYYAFYLAR